MRIPIGTAGPPLRLRMTPLIDVVFLLVTFFMLVSEISRQELADVELPPTRHNAPLDYHGPLVLNVLADGAYRLGGQTVSPRRLEDLLTVEARLSPEPQLIVRADRRTEFRHIRHILRLCTRRHIRIRRIAFGTTPLES